MPKGYWVARVDVDNAEEYAKYVAADGPVFERYQGRFIVRGGRFENPEGEARSRNVVIEFPSHELALTCWHSPEYQSARKHRLGHASFDLIIVEGEE
jgi:uncharacterized protein (DUF1330 family)